MKSLFKNTYMIPLLATMTIPLEKNGWTEISFGKIPPNIVTYSAKALNISVKNSASPLVYRFNNPFEIKNFSVTLKLKGDITSMPVEGQIEDDSVFRLGLVAVGEKTLSGVKKFFAPEWVKQFFALAPDHTGLDKIYFFNVGRTASQMGKLRLNPRSELISEEVVAVRNREFDRLHFLKVLDKPLKTAAVWISVDGDDSRSSFETTVEEISFNSDIH